MRKLHFCPAKLVDFFVFFYSFFNSSKLNGKIERKHQTRTQTLKLEKFDCDKDVDDDKPDPFFKRNYNQY